MKKKTGIVHNDLYNNGFIGDKEVALIYKYGLKRLSVVFIYKCPHNIHLACRLLQLNDIYINIFGKKMYLRYTDRINSILDFNV